MQNSIKKIAFIANPIAGGKSSQQKLKILKAYASAQNCKIYLTEGPGHARQLASNLKENFDLLGVFGGDGTINEVASELIHHTTAMAIIPAGSGNGLAYNLNIPIETNEALNNLNNEVRKIDTIQVNESFIINVGGLGFDGHVAKLFNESSSRGLFTYARLIITQLIRFKEQSFTVEANQSKTSGTAFMIAFANGSEFGNRFKIDPEGDATDGQFSLITVKKPPFFKLIPLLIDGFRGQLKESYYYRKQSLQELTISSPGATLHRDGEVSASATAESLNLKILPQSLRIIF